MTSRRSHASVVLVGPNPSHSDHLGQMRYLRMVQNASVGMSFNRAELATVGHKGTLSKHQMLAPEVTVDLSYYLSNGMNEQNLGFYVQNDQVLSGQNVVDFLHDNNQFSFTSSLGVYGPTYKTDHTVAYEKMNRQHDNRNIFLVMRSEQDDLLAANPVDEELYVLSAGNCYVSNYSINADLGSPVRTNVSLTASNLKIEEYVHYDKDIPTGSTVPAVNPFNGQDSDYYYAITTGTMINPDFRNGAIYGSDEEDAQTSPDTTFEGYTGVLVPHKIDLLISGEEMGVISDSSEDDLAYQSFSLELPIPRTPNYGLGNMYPSDQTLSLPLRGSFSTSVIVQDFVTGSLYNSLNQDKPFVIHALLRGYDPANNNYDKPYLQFKINGAYLESQDFSQEVNGRAIMNLSFSFEEGFAHENYTDSGHSPDYQTGIFVSGMGGIHGNSVISYGGNEAFAGLMTESGYFDAQEIFPTFIIHE